MQVNILAFTIGVWLLQRQAALPALEWWTALLLPLAAGGLCRPAALRRGLFAVAWAGAGFLWAATFAHFRLADELPQQWQGRDVRLVGVVAALPNTGERAQRFEFDVEKILTPDAVVPRHIQLTWYADNFGRKLPVPPPQVHAGERRQLTVRLHRPHGSANPHGFDFESWALERNLRAIGHVRVAEDNRLLTARVYRPGYLVEMAREAVARRFRTVLGDAPCAGVLTALAVGEQNAISQAQWQVFSRTGVTHLMSISGSHITMLSGLIYALVLALWRRSPALAMRLPAHKAAALAGVSAALVYVWLSGFGVPAQRTLYMLTVVAIALWMGRAGSASRVLCLALFAVLLLDPWAVLSPGFWLSFGAVGAIFYVSVGRLRRPHWLHELGLTQWAVTLGLIPALLLLFQQVSLISPLANAIAIPVIGILVTPLTLLGALPPFDFALLAAHQIMAWCMVLLETMSRLPDAVWWQHIPPFWTVAAAMCGIAWMLLPRGFPARGLGLAGLAPMFLVLPPQPPEGALWLGVLDVGQGLAAVVQTRRHALLFDAGARYNREADSGNRIIAPFLRAAGITKLDGMIVSHNDSDHSGGAISVMHAVPVGWLATSPDADPAILAQARRVLPCYAGQNWVWDDVRFDVLHPAWENSRDERVKKNDRSCVLKITTRHGSVLLPADAELRAEREMLARSPELLPSSVLVAGHHGSKSSSGEEFIVGVHPKTVVFTVGYRNRYGHPKPEIVERFRRFGAAQYRSDADGALLFRFEADTGIQMQAWRKAQPRYWYDSGI